MHITGMSIGDIPPISDRITMKFDERVNVFIGPNASGKSTVLLVLANHLRARDDKSKRPFIDDLWESDLSDDEFDDLVGEMTEDSQFNAIGLSDDWVDRYANLDERPKVTPVVVHIGSERIGMPGISTVGSAHSPGVTADEVLAEPFNGLQVQRALEVLGEEAWGSESNSAHHEKFHNFVQAIEMADSCAMTICKEIIRDAKTHHYIPRWDLQNYMSSMVTNPRDIRVIRGAAINTSDIRDFEILPEEERPNSTSSEGVDAESLHIYLGHLSSGTEGTLLWIRWLAFKLLHHCGFADDWHERPAILLIDEIENHLHPTWQRRVIPALLDHFSGLQIFATTHSPFVVAGLEKGQVHMLKRDEGGVVRARRNDHDIIGWTTDEILRTFMGVDEPTDQLTIDRRERLLELRRQDSLSDEESVEMEELRRHVNEDFLSSSSPLEAQRERYGDMMLEFLRSRQSELSQDGS